MIELTDVGDGAFQKTLRESLQRSKKAADQGKRVQSLEEVVDRLYEKVEKNGAEGWMRGSMRCGCSGRS